VTSCGENLPRPRSEFALSEPLAPPAGASGRIGVVEDQRDYHAGEKLDRDAVIDIECDIWIPAARPDVVREDNVARLETKLVLQGANIPFSPGAEQALHDRGVLVVPDFIANAGGVTCAAMEYRGSTESQAFQAIEETIRTNVEVVLSDAAEARIPPRQAGHAHGCRTC
jgi:glutamate dehydrogenase (NAD(P)+)